MIFQFLSFLFSFHSLIYKKALFLKYCLKCSCDAKHVFHRKICGQFLFLDLCLFQMIELKSTPMIYIVIFYFIPKNCEISRSVNSYCSYTINSFCNMRSLKYIVCIYLNNGYSNFTEKEKTWGSLKNNRLVHIRGMIQ